MEFYFSVHIDYKYIRLLKTTISISWTQKNQLIDVEIMLHHSKGHTCEFSFYAFLRHYINYCAVRTRKDKSITFYILTHNHSCSTQLNLNSDP